jgi:hypothetical protein
MTRPFSLRGVLTGRRLGDPVDLAVDPNIRAVRGRLAVVSVRASVGAGAWVGFALGLVLGVLAGGVLVWFAGAVLDWQRDLAFTFGVARRLLPFGDQVGLLRDVHAEWWLVVPVVGLVVGAIGAIFGALLGGILAAAYNRSPSHALVVVELPRHAMSALEGGPLPGGPTASAPAGAPTVPSPAPSPTQPAVLHSRPHGADREE